jgi:hypothetical protein
VYNILPCTYVHFGFDITNFSMHRQRSLKIYFFTSSMSIK